MKNNLYYPPTIEEFYVGFEYEIKIKDNWRKKSTTISDFSPISDYDGMSILEEDLISNIIRVKTLDQSDIESLGWQEFTYKSIDGFIMFEKLLTINYNYKEPVVDISYLPMFEKQGLSRIFRGIIKNKSELNKLMQQLNIK